jgi:hypothetical protein
MAVSCQGRGCQELVLRLLRRGVLLFWDHAVGAQALLSQCRIFFFFFFVVLGFELRASRLLGRHFYCLNHSTSPFL